ncbi:MAG: ABC transporter substrate-binding protein, partial [bacterium]
MSKNKSLLTQNLSRRSVIKGGTVAALAASFPQIWIKEGWAQGNFRNNPGSSGEIKLGFNYPQTGAYADEGADEFRAYQLAVKHLNGEGDGGMLNTMKPSMLKGNGILGKKVVYATGDTQTNTDKARSSAKRLIEKDNVIMVTGGSSSGPAVAVQALCQEM